ncbi:3-oxoacyl-[acyl-carrier-protein] synthase-3 [Streptomyces sp. DvalAA-14]|uniref:ketoacyl-ACP synthase III family protein n=1 Tax=unclassified Streptomyces TaxID=2593676 RepID=UPI00081B63A8|nr:MULTISPECIES: ketoacyl-ACP synthase III family protein [unclassified Streptomyces]MYS24418.1 3-oxoacyl-ACP synthase [Streptomyces sp. SID4948]SCE45839.1 3-oxoacyl-[acyl-carrier-protein] synthase-3 [Streptomyces sp. DvalAA-14]
MQWNDIYVGGVAAWLGHKEDVQEALADGRYDAEEHEENDYLFVRVEDDLTPADMAVEAARAALERAGTPAGGVGIYLHAASTFQGLDHWTPGSYIQQHTAGGTAPSLEIRQACNGAIMALELAAAYLTAKPEPSTALVTTGDRYDAPAYDRYRTDKNILLADGATALALTRGHGVARLLSTATVGDTSHEALGRGTSGWQQASGDAGWPISLRERKKEYLIGGGDIKDIIRTMTLRQQQAMDTALGDAGVEAGDIARYVYPNIGRIAQDWEVRKAAGITEEQTTWAWGREVGHIAAGDQFAGLAHLLESGAVRAGDRVALAGVGSGYNFGWAVLEILQEPQWSTTAS